jgi:hypothetical protein
MQMGNPNHRKLRRLTAGTEVGGDPDEQARAVIRVAVALAAAELNRRARLDHRVGDGLALAELAGIVGCWPPEDEVIAS